MVILNKLVVVVVGGGGHKESLGSGVPQRPFPLFSTKIFFICLPCLFSDAYSFSLQKASSRKRQTK